MILRHHDTFCTPLHFQLNLHTRRIMVLLVFAGSLCAVVGILARWHDQQVIQVLTSWRSLLIMVGVFVVYTVYLFASIEHGVLDPSVSRFQIVPSMILPTATFLAYVCMPLEVLFFGATKTLSYVAFPLMYLCWTLYNLERLWRIRNQHGTEKAKVAVWFVIDGFLAGLLIWNLQVYLKTKGDLVSFHALGPKDFAITASASLYLGWKWTTRQTWFDPYRNDMTDFVRRIQPGPAPPPDVNVQPGENILSENWKAEQGEVPYPIKAVDFGSGGSERSVQLLKWVGVNTKRVKLTRYDLDERYREPETSVVAELADHEFTSKFLEAKAAVAEASIILVSHALYTPRSVRDLCRLIDASQQELVILVRGGSPDSFLAPLVKYRLFSWMRPFYSACWDTDTIPYLMKRLQLVCLHADRTLKFLPGPLLLQQHVPIDRHGLQHLLGPLRHHYGERIRQTVELLIRRQLEIANLRGSEMVNIPHSDLVYILCRPARPKSQPVEI